MCALPEPEPHNMKSFRKWLRDQAAGNFCIGGNGEESTWGYLYDTEGKTGSLKWQFLKPIWSLIWFQPAPSDDLDLVSPLPPRKIDGFSRWVASRFIPFYANYQKYKQKRRDKSNPNASDKGKSQDDTYVAIQPPRPKPRTEFHKETLATYSERSILRFTSAVSTTVACLLPTIAITVLSQVHGTKNLLLSLAEFAIIFAVGLIYLTNGTVSRLDIFTATAAYVVLYRLLESHPHELQAFGSVGSVYIGPGRIYACAFAFFLTVSRRRNLNIIFDIASLQCRRNFLPLSRDFIYKTSMEVGKSISYQSMLDEMTSRYQILQRCSFDSKSHWACPSRIPTF